MNGITYKFEELEAIPGFCILVSGKAEISYTMEPADPDVGYRGGVDFEVNDIYIESLLKEVPDMKVEPDTWLYEAITNQLYRGKHADYIMEECEENEESRGYDDY